METGIYTSVRPTETCRAKLKYFKVFLKTTGTGWAREGDAGGHREFEATLGCM